MIKKKSWSASEKNPDGLFESGPNLSCSKLQAAYEYRTVIRLDRAYLPNIERLYKFNHHLRSNQNRVFTKIVV